MGSVVYKYSTAAFMSRFEHTNHLYYIKWQIISVFAFTILIIPNMVSTRYLILLSHCTRYTYIDAMPVLHCGADNPKSISSP